jgi:mRNA interferase MazF
MSSSTEPGQIWWAQLDERCLVVVVPGGAGADVRAMRIVDPATTGERRGFALLTGAEALDQQRVATADGIEVAIGAGVVRVALPRDGTVFCTWLVTLTPPDLIEAAGAVSPEKLAELTNALRLAGV